MVENKITSAAFDDPRWMLIRASKIGIALTLTAGLISAIIIVTSPLALEISRLTLRRPDSVIAFYLVTLDPKNAAQKNNLGIRLRHRDGRNSEGRVRDGAFVMPWFMNIPYDNEKQASRYRKLWPRVLPLWRDAVTLDDARRTRVKLRWH
jgi:hypothetical protein